MKNIGVFSMKLGDQSIGVDADVSKLAGLKKLVDEAVGGSAGWISW